jgi:hypothetical protein
MPSCTLRSQKGDAVKLTVRGADNATKPVEFTPRFEQPFGEDVFNLLGLVPRMQIESIIKDRSPVQAAPFPAM